MNTITIQVSGEELEVLNIELTAEEVAALYKLRKETATKIAELKKSLATEKSNKESAWSSRNDAQAEIGEANMLLSALGIPEKTNHEESYYRKDLKVATRIALYIAGVKTA